MNYLNWLFFFAISTVLCHSDSICAQVELKLFIRSCDGSVSPLNGFVIQKVMDDASEDFYSGESNQVELPDTGRYQLSLIEFKEVFPYRVNITNQTDTLFESRVKLKVGTGVSTANWEYTCCGIPCEGKNIGQFPTGNTMIKGCFRKGKPVGDLEFYDYYGNIVKIERYSKKGRLIRTKLFDNRP